MHDELIAALRFCDGGECDGCCRYKKEHGAECYTLLRDAADAIEELQQTVEHYKGCSDDWYREACDYKAMLPRWIPVTERLPEDDQQVLAYYGFDRGDGYLGMMFMQVLDYFARDPRPHFQHEGTNGMRVSHWMPLPEPPKEEA